MERYFRLNLIEEGDKVEASVVAMEERALNWFQWWETQTEERNWEALKEAIIRRFQPDLIQNPYGPMLSLKQRGTVKEYREEFEMVIAPQRNFDRDILRGIFINGLKPEIKSELKLFNSRSLAEIMDTSLLIETRNEALYIRNKEEDKSNWKDKGPITYKPAVWGEGYKSKSSNSWPSTSGKNAAENKSNPSWFTPEGKKETEINPSDIRRVGPQLSQEEYLDRSRKGLCFKCGEKWNKEHSCKLKNYKLIMVEDSDNEEDIEGAKVEIKAEEGTTMEFKSMQLSVMSKEGIHSLRTFKVNGSLEWAEGKAEVAVLIDSGATHNFISQNLVKQLELPYTTTPGYKVQIGNGEKVSNNGRCENLTLCMQGTNIKQKFYMLNLEGTDLVLGMEWLTTLGNVEINFQKQSIKWKVQGVAQQIQGDPHLNSMEISLKTMTQILQDTGVGYFMFCEGQSVNEKSVACAGSLEKNLGALTKSWVQDDPQFITIEEYMFNQCDAKLGVTVKKSAVKLGEKILKP
ncbi:unnamed protein product, partial [Cuscuta epithymum]